MKPYNLDIPRRNPNVRDPKHPRTCPLCGIIRPYRTTSRKVIRSAARISIKKRLRQLTDKIRRVRYRS